MANDRGSSTIGMELRWSYVLRVKRGDWHHRGATLYPGRGATPSASTSVALVPTSRQTPAPRAATGHRVRPNVRAHGRSWTVTVARPPVVPQVHHWDYPVAFLVRGRRADLPRVVRRPASHAVTARPPHLCEIANPSFRRPRRARGVRPGGAHGPGARPRPPLPLPARTCPRRPLSPPWSGCGARSTPRASSSGQARGMHWATFRRVGVRLRRRGGIHPPRRDGGMTYARGRGHDVC